MSKVKIQGNASGSGVFTLTTPNTSTDRTITLPDASGTLAFTTDDDDKMPLSGGAFSGAVTTNSTFDGRDVAADGVLATNALPKAGGITTGNIRMNNKLSFNAAANASAQIFLRNTVVDDRALYIEGDETTANTAEFYNNVAGSGRTGNVLRVYQDGSAAAGSALFVHSDGDTAAVFSGGKVGIGTDSPTSMLHIQGAFGNSSPSPMIYIRNTNGPAEIKLQAGGDSWTLDTDYDADNLIIRGSGTEVIRFKQDGRAESQFTIAAWVNFDGRNTVAIRDSHNVSSIGDWGTGQYGIYFTTGFANSNYAYASMAQDSRIVSVERGNGKPDGSRLDVTCERSWDAALTDNETLSVLVIGDQ